jgi:hypothetical protein
VRVQGGDRFSPGDVKGRFFHVRKRSYLLGGSRARRRLVSHTNDVKHLTSEIDGFKAYYLVRTADGAVSISVYENEAGTDEATRAAATWIRENLPELGGASPHVSAGEVVISA